MVLLTEYLLSYNLIGVLFSGSGSQGHFGTDFRIFVFEGCSDLVVTCLIPM